MHSLIIHMPGSTARRPNVDRLLQDLPDAQVVDAVNGRDPHQIAEVKTFAGDLHEPQYPFALTPGEIGCFQSHRKCWELIAKSDSPYALVVEDDVAISLPQMAQSLTLIQAHMTPDMFVRLPMKKREAGPEFARDGKVSVFLPKRIGLQTGCQIVGRAAAQRLLARSEQIDRPIDTWLQMHWVTGQPIHALLPNGVTEIANQIGGSTIQQKTRTSGKLMRELRRTWYRAQVALRPQRP